MSATKEQNVLFKNFIFIELVPVLASGLFKILQKAQRTYLRSKIKLKIQ